MGFDEWSWDRVEPYFRQIENVVAHPGSEARGHDGPIDCRQSDVPYEWGPYLDKAAQNIGLPLARDLNDPKAPAMGLYRVGLAIDRQGRRRTAYHGYLYEKVALERRSRLAVCTGASASRLDVDGEAGAVRGVLGARGIPVAGELPRVGASLADHYAVPVQLEVPLREFLTLLQRALHGLWHMLLWLLLGLGLMRHGTNLNTIFVRSGALDADTFAVRLRGPDDGLDNMDASRPHNVPNLEVMIMPVPSFKRPLGGPLLSLFPCLVQPFSTGRVELPSPPPGGAAADLAFAPPHVTDPMLRDPRDLLLARVALRFTMRLAAEFQVSGYPHPAPFAFAPGNRPDNMAGVEALRARPGVDAAAGRGARDRRQDVGETVTDEEIHSYVRSVVITGLHTCCSCRMSADPATGVVDQRLRVHGVRNLRIADTSVFPRIPSTHTMLPVMMVGERCADFIKEEWVAKSKTA